MHNSQVRSDETPEQREVRLSALRMHRSKVRKAEKSQIEAFNKTINIFCDKVCEICTKRCYPHQVTNHKINLSTASYLPAELTSKGTILLCHRCKKHLTSKKTSGPAKAYWNNLDPGEVPDAIKQLTQPEQRLLSRIIPFVKIVKYDGLFGQYGFRGQAVLFVQDIFEFTESLPNILPRSTDSIGMVVITEHLENLNISREYNISRPRVYEALRWLINNNPLYQDVITDNDAQILQEDLIRVTQAINNENAQNNNQALLETATVSAVGEATNTNDAYKMINNSIRVLRASWHQGNNQVFNTNHAVSQCCAMVLANITRAAILAPHSWTNNILNTNMLEGDAIYAEIRQLSIDNPLSYLLLIRQAI
ncbi:ATP-dependent DNA helicase [Trichonephila clavata]|uniref:ATP-dependent DNA helicase n=1 Tax=Trichonephila clavata TaxID=2740835 RepID=A0A8X6LB46_TRICU|nr:ATP-dependent DNA helicase [Trichonephila clavata]